MEKEAVILENKKRIVTLEQMMEENVKQHQEILDLLKPISDTYTTVGRLSKWVMACLVFLSVLGGVVWTWGNIFKK